MTFGELFDERREGVLPLRRCRADPQPSQNGPWQRQFECSRHGEERRCDRGDVGAEGGAKERPQRPTAGRGDLGAGEQFLRLPRVCTAGSGDRTLAVQVCAQRVAVPALRRLLDEPGRGRVLVRVGELGDQDPQRRAVLATEHLRRPVPETTQPRRGLAAERPQVPEDRGGPGPGQRQRPLVGQRHGRRHAQQLLDRRRVGERRRAAAGHRPGARSGQVVRLDPAQQRERERCGVVCGPRLPFAVRVGVLVLNAVGDPAHGQRGQVVLKGGLVESE